MSGGGYLGHQADPSIPTCARCSCAITGAALLVPIVSADGYRLCMACARGLRALLERRVIVSRQDAIANAKRAAGTNGNAIDLRPDDGDPDAVD